MNPGVYRDIPNETYHSGPGDSKSGLDLVRKSPALLRAVKTGQRERKSTKSQLTGTAIHAMVLEPQLVASTYALPFVAPEGALVTVEHLKAALTEAGVAFKQATKKEGLEALVREHLPDAVLWSDARAEYDEANRGKVIIEAPEWDRLENMLAAVRAHPAAMKLLSAPGESELSCYWEEPVTDPVTGEHLHNDDGSPAYLLMRCRPDFWRHDGIVVDLKSTSPGGAAPEEFARSLDNWRYYVQHPMYLRGAAAALAATRDGSFAQFASPRHFVFVVVETDACVVDGVAMGVAVYNLQPDSVALGEAEMREDIATLHACQQSGRWPGYSERIEAIELPAYAFTRAAARAGVPA
jgi:exodeoxyribonuclease VIII